MWQAIFVKPVLNLLILIQNFMPGQDLGLAILVFTIIVRVLMWPLIKKQIHQTRIMQKVAPEVNAIRAKAKGSKDRQVLQQVNTETMAIYKKHGISPFGSVSSLLIQLPLFIAIYSAVRTAFAGTQNLGELLYAPIKNLPYVQEFLAEGGHKITTFAEWADLAQKPFGANEVYIPVLVVALVSIAIQYLQIKQTLPKKNSAAAKSDDPQEKLNNVTPYIMVILFGWISLSVEGAISFYLASGSLVAIFQQTYLLKQEKESEVALEASKPKVRIINQKEEKKQASSSAKVTNPKKTSTKKTPTKKTAPKKKAPAKKNPKTPAKKSKK